MSELFMIAPVSSKAMMANWMMMLPLTLLMFISSSALIWMVKASNEVQFEIRTHEIQIRYPFYGKTIAKKDLDLANARLIDLKQEPGFSTSWRSNGVGLFGFQAGWFRLKNKQKVLAFCSDSQQSRVYIPSKQKFGLLLTPKEPEKFLESLKQ